METESKKSDGSSFSGKFRVIHPSASSVSQMINKGSNSFTRGSTSFITTTTTDDSTLFGGKKKSCFSSNSSSSRNSRTPGGVSISNVKLVQNLKYCIRNFTPVKNFYVAILIPIICLPLIVNHYGSKEMRCAYVCLVTVAFLITQALPLALSSLLPALLFPIFGILTVKEVSSKYFQDPVLLFFASVILAKGIQSVNLHKRLALTLLMHTGSKPIWMIFGFIMSTFFISIWINNSATAVLMTPVAKGVIDEYYKYRKSKRNSENASNNSEAITISETLSKHKDFNEEKNEQSVIILTPIKSNVKEKFGSTLTIDDLETELDVDLENLRKCIFIGIAYSCNIGGTASLTGTPPNMIFTGFLNVLFGPKAEINFMAWLLYSLPGAIVIIFFMWFSLCCYFIGTKNTVKQMLGKVVMDDPRSSIREQLSRLGKFKQKEITMGILFITLVCLWIFRNPQFIPGWQIFFETGYISDATPALLIALLLFIVPSDFRSILFIRNEMGKIPKNKPILEWNKIYKNLLWDINLLLGGGIAMALGFKVSGLSKLLVKSFSIFADIPKQLLVLLFAAITSLLTEVLNNIATASILLPIISDIAVSIRVNPLYLLFPATLSASYCFMLPIGTAPNAIVYSAGNLKFFDMVKPGIIVHIICLVVTYISINTYGIPILKIKQFPDWAIPQNSSISLA